ncbi:MAG: hypothetical protein ACOVP4_12340 [Bacteriovoracaceae bacterium]
MKLIGLLIVMMISTACEQSFNLEALDELTSSTKTSSNKKVNSGSSTATDKSGSKQASDKSGSVQESDKSGSVQASTAEKDSSGVVQAKSR